MSNSIVSGDERDLEHQRDFDVAMQLERQMLDSNAARMMCGRR